MKFGSVCNKTLEFVWQETVYCFECALNYRQSTYLTPLYNRTLMCAELQMEHTLNASCVTDRTP